MRTFVKSTHYYRQNMEMQRSSLLKNKTFYFFDSPRLSEIFMLGRVMLLGDTTSRTRKGRDLGLHGAHVFLL